MINVVEEIQEKLKKGRKKKEKERNSGRKKERLQRIYGASNKKA